MNVKVIIGNKIVEVPHEIFSHALTCHRLGLHEWEKREQKKFTDNLMHGLDRGVAEQHLGWLYDELEKIEGHRKANDELKTTLGDALMVHS